MANHVRISNVSNMFTSDKEQLLALKGINLDVPYGQFLCILGPSGCGKTTMLRIIGGLLKPSSGGVTIGGKSPSDVQQDKAVGFVFQEPALLPWRTVTENVCLPLQINQSYKNDSRRTAEEYIHLVGLGKFQSYYPFQLSGGMQQRVALARALAFKPSLLLMDEPLAALDEITRGAMRYELLRIWDNAQQTVILVTHSVTDAIILSDRVVVLSSQPGRIKHIVDIDLQRPRSKSLEWDEKFMYYSTLLHGLLMEDQ